MPLSIVFQKKTARSTVTSDNDSSITTMAGTLHLTGAVPKSLGVSLEREGLDAKKSVAFIDAWTKIAKFFNLDDIFTHPDQPTAHC